MPDKLWAYLLVFLLCAGLILFVAAGKIPLGWQQAPATHPSSLTHIETMGFDETEVNADVAVISFRIQAFALEESKARLEFLRKVQEIEAQLSEREIPFQLIPKSSEPFVFVQPQPAQTPTMQSSFDITATPTPPASKIYSVTQDFSLPLLLARSPPIPLFLDTLASNGALVSNVTFPISAQRKSGAERASLLKAIADARTKASFLATEQQRTLGSVLEIIPVNIKIEQVKDPTLDLLMGQLEEQQQKYQQQLKIQQLQREQTMNPYAPPHPLLIAHQQQQMQQMMDPATMMGRVVTSSTASMDPLKVFGSALVPKKVAITTHVKVRFACM
jgi:uncharacterized protein YggE